MKQNAKVLVSSKEQAPECSPEPDNEMELEADTLRDAAMQVVGDERYRVRFISFGPDCLVVYLEEVQP